MNCMKMKPLHLPDNSSMFALLCVLALPRINALNKVISAARFFGFHDTSGDPFTTRSDTPSHSGRVRISWGSASGKICVSG